MIDQVDIKKMHHRDGPDTEKSRHRNRRPDAQGGSEGNRV